MTTMTSQQIVDHVNEQANYHFIFVMDEVLYLEELRNSLPCHLAEGPQEEILMTIDHLKFAPEGFKMPVELENGEVMAVAWALARTTWNDKVEELMKEWNKDMERSYKFYP